jgi:hygromycin-B 7''-O-kinase
MDSELCVVELRPPAIASDEDYARRLGDGAFWEPMARAALDLARLDQPAQLRPGRPLGTYPTLLTDTGLVVKLFGDRWSGPESHRAELEAYQVIAGHDLPVPRLIAAGQLFPDATSTWPWPFLILTGLRGATYAALAATLDGAARRRVASDVGRLLRRLHSLPLMGRRLAPSWSQFMALLRRRRSQAPQDHRRWGVLPPRLCRQLDGWLPDPGALVDTGRPPCFVHGDLHDEHVFLDPASRRLVGIIDFTDVHAGDPRYDLVALHFGTFHTDKALLQACLDAYGWGERPASWPRDMLALTLLHDFNMLRPGMPLDRFATLDDLADAIWRLDAPGLNL